MKLVLEVSSVEDAAVAHSVLDAYADAKGQVQKVDQGQSFEISKPVSNAAVADHAEGFTPGSSTPPSGPEIKPFAPTPHEEVLAKAEEVLNESSEEGYSKQQIKQAAEHDFELKRLISGKGRRSAEQKAEIQRRTAAYFAGTTYTAETEEPVGHLLAGASAEELQAALDTSEESAPEPDQYTHMTKDELLAAVSAFADNFKDELEGFRWLKNAWGGKQENATVERLRAALRDPESFLA